MAIDMDAQTITTGNNAYDAGTSVGIVGVTHLHLHNQGSVVIHIALTQAAATAGDAAIILAAGERGELRCNAGDGPTSLWTKGVGAAGTLKVTAANKGARFTVDSTADALAAALSQIKVRTLTVGHADLTDADTSETITDTAGAFPAGSVLMGYSKNVATAFSGGAVSAVTVDVGFNGATDVLDDGQSVFTGVSGYSYGAGGNALPLVRRQLGGLTLQAKFDSVDGDVADLTAGSVTFNVYYAVPAAG